MNVINSDLSIVIPSLGSGVLRTIESINSGLMIPNEIIIVVPRINAKSLSNIDHANARYELVDFKGQVAQRIHGFKISRCKYVLQCDDDIVFDELSIKLLFDALISIEFSAAVGPELRFLNTRKSAYEKNNSLVRSISELIFGPSTVSDKMGMLNRSGSCYGVDFGYINEKVIPTQWLAGGCVLHKRENLIVENYFPFEGKAYGEDLMHSVLLSNNGVGLFVIKDAICFIDFPEKYNNIRELLKDYRCRRHIIKMRLLALWPVHLWFIYKLLRLIIGKILALFKNSDKKKSY